MPIKRKKKSPPKKYDVHRTLPPKDLKVPKAGPAEDKQPEPDGKKHRRSKKRIAGLGITGILLAGVVFIMTIAIWDWHNFSRASDKMFGSSSVFSLINPSSLQTDEHGRVNVLVVGYSVDDPGHPGAQLTDSILLLSMDPGSHSGYMLSIPRDLYVSIPGYGYGKINEVYRDGGIKLLEEVVSQDFKVSPNYSAIVNYGAVRGIVNSLGGITVCIKSPDPRGLFDPNINRHDHGPLKLSNGCHALDGQTALNLTRARGDAYNSYGFPRSDFDRTMHQRQVFTAIKQKITWKVLADPRKNSQLFDTVATNVKTDLDLSEVRPLYGLFHSIPDSKMKSVSLNDINGRNLLSGYVTPGGLSALIPAAGFNDYSQIDAAIQSL